MSIQKFYHAESLPAKVIKLEIKDDSDLSNMQDDFYELVSFSPAHDFSGHVDNNQFKKWLDLNYDEGAFLHYPLWKESPTQYFKLAEIVIGYLQDYYRGDVEYLVGKISTHMSACIDVGMMPNSEGTEWVHLPWLYNAEDSAQSLGSENIQFDHHWFIKQDIQDVFDNQDEEGVWWYITCQLLSGGLDTVRLYDELFNVPLEAIKAMVLDAFWKPNWVMLSCVDHSYLSWSECERDSRRATAIYMPDQPQTSREISRFCDSFDRFSNGWGHAVYLDDTHECGGFLMDEDETFAEAKSEYIPDDAVEISEEVYDAFVFLNDKSENEVQSLKVLEEAGFTYG